MKLKIAFKPKLNAISDSRAYCILDSGQLSERESYELSSKIIKGVLKENYKLTSVLKMPEEESFTEQMEKVSINRLITTLLKLIYCKIFYK